MINLIREYLLKLVDNIDAGNSNLTEDETIKLISVLKELTDNDEVDAYLLTYIYIKILEVFRKHDKVVNR